jgi:hypothetical protein
MISAMDEPARCIAFDRHVTLRGASERAEIPEGWVARHRGLPSVFSLNMVILRSPVSPTLGPADVEILSDRWLDDVGHRFIRIEDPAAADRLAPALLKAGWQRQRTLLMRLTEDAPAPEPDPRARPISEAELNAVMRADFELDFPRHAFPAWPTHSSTPSVRYARGPRRCVSEPESTTGCSRWARYSWTRAPMVTGWR